MAFVLRLATLMFTFCQITGTLTSRKLALECGTVLQVDSGQDGVLHCSVMLRGKSFGDVKIKQVVWWRQDQNHQRTRPPVLQYSSGDQRPNGRRFLPSQRYQLSVSFEGEKDNDVSLLVSEARPADEGLYECVVNTDHGQWNCTTILVVTEPVLKDPGIPSEMPRKSFMWVAAVFVVVASLASGLLLLKLFQTAAQRQHEPEVIRADFDVADGAELEESSVPAKHQSGIRKSS
ncbi:hypothetical protein DPEC_G00307780 [Dallia pectoralis]|uniref:Uncharacterized protein n=1 Tax=Dallia pectoralis TaxID=75939 RepID=A0ACC2FEJ9_DALPE|nr:hypothetical protein DPEC_G00307780 [Dallia pectoralis]